MWRDDCLNRVLFYKDQTMKKTVRSLFVILPLSLSLSACVVAVNGEDYQGYRGDFESREYENRKHIANLRLEMSYQQIQNILGVADFNESYQKNNEMIQVLFYRTNRQHKDGLTTKDECTPLVFKNGLLVSWGENAYSQL